MTDVPNFEQHRLNSFEDKLLRMQADLTGLRRILSYTIASIRWMPALTRWKPAWKP